MGFCTSFVKNASPDIELVQHLQQAESAAVRFLECAQQHGPTLVITNAKRSWVEQSAAQWAPKLLHSLKSLTVISARDHYASLYPIDVNQWKLQTFLDVMR